MAAKPSFTKVNPFRGENGSLLTRALFADVTSYQVGQATEADLARSLYVMWSEEDQGRFKSLYKLYMLMADPSEVMFARAYFESYEHWLTICEAPWAKEHINRWRTELDLSIRAAAVKAIYDKSIDPTDKDCFMASRFLVQNGYSLKVAPKPAAKTGLAGRPTREAIKKEAEALFFTAQDEADDLARLQAINPPSKVN
jgi:hypothetical protein